LEINVFGAQASPWQTTSRSTGGGSGSPRLAASDTAARRLGTDQLNGQE
jgi:hypothetical protein